MRDLSARRACRFPHTFAKFGKHEIEQTIQSRFEQQVSQRPDQIAVRFESEELTYSQLDCAANRIAHSLRPRSNTDFAPVGVFLDQGIQLVIWFLAIMKAGLIYVPVDRRLPASTLAGVIDALDPCALVVSSDTSGLARTLANRRCSIIDASISYDEPRDESLKQTATANDIATIYYTSGSTGTPKGVADCHRNILHNIMRYTNTLGFSPVDRMSMVQHPSFSGSVSSMLGALLNGATVLPFDLARRGLHTLSDWLQKERVTVFHSVPFIFRHLAKTRDSYPDLRLVRLEGDQATNADIEHFRSICGDDCVLVNGLGATECGVVRQFFVTSGTRPLPDDPIPVGYAVKDMAAHIIDENGDRLPHGNAGEIVVESPYLAVGYWKNAILTGQKFRNGGNACRYYHTGDLGRLDSDGCLTHLGRMDQRVKIAGSFVDFATVESALTKMKAISQARVRDYTDSMQERRLSAFIVTDGTDAPTITDIHAHLTEHIARHMIPTIFMFLDKLPLSDDFKVDRRRLHPDRIPRHNLKNEYVAPRTLLERKLVSIWSGILEIEKVGVTDDYFELGGDSLRAMKILGRMKETLETDISLRSFFQNPTIREVVHLMGDSTSSSLEVNK